MDATVITAIISALSAVLIAIIGIRGQKINKETAEQTKRVEERAKKRAEEGKLQLELMSANTELTVGIAYALKRGKCNGEVEEGLQKVNEAQAKYKKFLEEYALENIK